MENQQDFCCSRYLGVFSLPIVNNKRCGKAFIAFKARGALAFTMHLFFYLCLYYKTFWPIGTKLFDIIKIVDVAWLSMRQSSTKWQSNLNVYRIHYVLQIMNLSPYHNGSCKRPKNTKCETIHNTKIDLIYLKKWWTNNNKQQCSSIKYYAWHPCLSSKIATVN